MGTRNLTMVIQDQQTKVAQYGQWDGYPEGQGLTILNYLAGPGNIDKLKDGLKKTRFIEPDGRDKEFIDSYNKNVPEWSRDPDNRTQEQINWFKSFTSRDIGGEILANISEHEGDEILLVNKEWFAADSLMCEWAYVVDFDKNTFEVYEGFNKKPLTSYDRFYYLKGEDGYHPVKLRKTFDLNSLPNEADFSKEFQIEEVEE